LRTGVKLNIVRSLENAHPREFFDRNTPRVARELLGGLLCRRLPSGEILSGRIVETEAYRENEPACHAARGITKRNAVLFGPSGIAYVYFIYGSYHCFNVVTESEGSGCAILIRAVEGLHTNGPGKLCRAWEITREHNGIDLTDSSSELWIAPGDALKRSQIGVSSRIGISAAQELQWRFFEIGHASVSGPKSYNDGSFPCKLGSRSK
jgi:DNA-3-methyladenine glycosylase